MADTLLKTKTFKNEEIIFEDDDLKKTKEIEKFFESTSDYRRKYNKLFFILEFRNLDFMNDEQILSNLYNMNPFLTDVSYESTITENINSLKNLKVTLGLLREAISGDAKSQNNLAYCFKYGENCQINKKEAFYWYNESANNGYSYAQNQLAICYEEGTGVDKNIDKAIFWYEAAAKQGVAYAQNFIGDCYYFGELKNKDYDIAFSWYLKAAEQNDGQAIHNLGICYENGQGAERDLDKAIELYKKSIDLGCVDAFKSYNILVAKRKNSTSKK